MTDCINAIKKFLQLSKNFPAKIDWPEYIDYSEENHDFIVQNTSLYFNNGDIFLSFDLVITPNKIYSIKNTLIENSPVNVSELRKYVKAREPSVLTLEKRLAK